MTIQNASWPTLVERWRHLDELGFDSAWVADYFANPWYPGEPWLEGWTLLSALAVHTRKIRLGTMVTNISQRRCLHHRCFEVNLTPVP